jgi:broad specificity phosphatase PhoE
MARPRSALPAARTTTLVLLRHAQTDSNAAGPNPRLSGWTDVPLNAAGWQQVARLQRRFCSEAPIAALYSSPLLRARETAESIAGVSGTSPRLIDALREINCGVVDGNPIAEVKRSHRELWEKNLRQDDDDFRWPGGESYREFRDRCLRAINWIAAAHCGQRVVVVTHAGVITQILGALHGVRPARWEPFRPENTSLTELRWTAGRLALLVFNDHRHLTAW